MTCLELKKQCKYIPIGWETTTIYPDQTQNTPVAIQKATMLVCENCLDQKNIMYKIPEPKPEPIIIAKEAVQV